MQWDSTLTGSAIYFQTGRKAFTTWSVLLENGLRSGVVCWLSGGSRWRRGWKFEGSAGEGVKEQGPPITQPWLVRMAKLSSTWESRPNEDKSRGGCREEMLVCEENGPSQTWQPCERPSYTLGKVWQVTATATGNQKHEVASTVFCLLLPRRSEFLLKASWQWVSVDLNCH